jgi:hypothetical protein
VKLVILGLRSTKLVTLGLFAGAQPPVYDDIAPVHVFGTIVPVRLGESSSLVVSARLGLQDATVPASRLGAQQGSATHGSLGRRS